MSKTKKQVRLVALETLANRGVAKGATFEASAEDARVLIGLERATKAPEAKAKAK